MTDLDEMTSEEIRLEIAERRGWVKFDFDDNRWVLRKDDNYRWESEFYETESIAAAWELAEEMPHISIGDESRNTEVRMWWCNVYFDTNYTDEPDFLECGDTAPLAICKAWLAWQRSKE